jgi:hypothetical protein
MSMKILFRGKSVVMVKSIKSKLIRILSYLISKLSGQIKYEHISFYSRFKNRTVEIIIKKAKPLQSTEVVFF